MSHPFVLTPSAARDIDDILEYVLEAGGPDRALHVLRKLCDGLAMVSENPGVGHLRDDLADETLRVWRVFSYLIIYRPQTTPLQVVRVIHGARDIPTALDEVR